MKINIQKYFKYKNNLKPLIIAEISANHCGSKSLFLKTIKSAAKNGADLIKIQTYEPEDITIDKSFDLPNWNKKKIWKLYSKAQTPYKWHHDAFKLAKKLNIELFSTPFSKRAVDFLLKKKVKLFKISSFEINDFNLVKKIASTKKPIILSTGMASLNEIRECVNIIKKFHNKIILLHCVSGYPTPDHEANLMRISSLKKYFKNINIGLSDHSDDILSSISSIPLGAKVIEKHFILSKKLKSFDRNFSITPQQLKILSTYTKKIFLNLGDGKFKIQKKEQISIKFRRSIFSIKNIKKGEKLSQDNISTFRPAIGLSAKYYFQILGKKAKKDIEANTPIYSSFIK
tara:strand:+ start:3760 stop:4791 length:1032 start_codon:yes stop_codon:yes gene_type:complete